MKWRWRRGERMRGYGVVLWGMDVCGDLARSWGLFWS